MSSKVKNIKRREKIIRLRSRGRKYFPIYDIVLTFKDNRNRGPIIEKLGFFNPNFSERLFFINTYRLAFWLNRGVFFNETVKKYLVKMALITSNVDIVCTEILKRT